MGSLLRTAQRKQGCRQQICSARRAARSKRGSGSGSASRKTTGRRTDGMAGAWPSFCSVCLSVFNPFRAKSFSAMYVPPLRRSTNPSFALPSTRTCVIANGRGAPLEQRREDAARLGRQALRRRQKPLVFHRHAARRPIEGLTTRPRNWRRRRPPRAPSISTQSRLSLCRAGQANTVRRAPTAQPNSARRPAAGPLISRSAPVLSPRNRRRSGPSQRGR